MPEVIETSGEETKEEAAPETPKSNGAEDPPETPATEAKVEEAKPEEAKPEEKPREPSQAVLDATAAMGQAAAVSPEEAQVAADRMERELLLETLSFQVPEAWLQPDVSARLSAMPTPALATMLTWLSLTWWQGYEHGRVETTNALERALKTAAEKGFATEKDHAAMDAVKREIRAEQREISESIEGQGQGVKSP